VRPTMTFFSIATISMAWSGQNDQRVVQTRRIHQNLIVADPFEDQDDSLRGRMDEVEAVNAAARSTSVSPQKLM
jgi:hypothetical protein